MRVVVVVRDVVAVVQVVVVLRVVVVVAAARGRYIGDFLVLVVRTQFFSFFFALAFFFVRYLRQRCCPASPSLFLSCLLPLYLSRSLPVRPSIQFEAI